jgi:HD-like signal output (HDOD) protein
MAVQAAPSQMSAYVLDLWGLPIGVVKAISLMNDPEADTDPGFSITSALYIADHLASRTSPPDSFALEDWKTDYLEAIGCTDDIAEWEKKSTASVELAHH